MNREVVPTREIHHAKADHDYSLARPDRHFGGGWADGWLTKSIRTISIDEHGQSITAGGAGRPPPTAGRSSARREEPDGRSERSNQSRERGA
jgi:hypothetical protein